MRGLPLPPCWVLVASAIISSIAPKAFGAHSSFNVTAVESLEQWQRVALQSPARAGSRVTIIIQTEGPRMTGLIRISRRASVELRYRSR